jgi:23S rRNA (uracil1939-C5)-methyltransferase
MKKPLYSSKKASHRQKETTFSRAVFAAQVQDLASDGRGVITHPDGRVCFVAGVWPGEKGDFRLTAIKGRTATAELVTLHEPVSARVTAPCPHHGHSVKDCGGCPWQFVSYQAQLAAKQARVEKALQGLCGRKGVQAVCKPIWGSPQTAAYRNRAQLKTDGARLGYLAAASHNLIDVEQCLVLSEANQKTLSDLRNQLPNADWKPARRHSWTTLNIDESVSAENVSVNARLAFQQGNSRQNMRMREWLAQQAASLNRNLPLVELFCGAGNFTEVLAHSQFTKVFAVDVAGDALQVLQQKQLPDVDVLAVNLYDDTRLDKVTRLLSTAGTLFLDPPRDGLQHRDALLKRAKSVTDILYVSCNLATFVRDIADFICFGYSLLEVQPLDQFPHTAHIELLARLKRTRRD